jgi:hypothetical protein
MAARHRQRRRVDLRPFAASVFAPHLFTGDRQPRAGCGATALALITGATPENIATENGAGHYSDRFMTRFLRARGYHTLRFTPGIATCAEAPVGGNHVLLISQLFKPTEGTWGVIFGDLYYHNFEIYSLSALSFLNKPIMSVYLVIHPQWKIDSPAKHPKLPGQASGLKLSALCKHCESTSIRPWR